MIEGISHVTFIVKDLERTTMLFKALFQVEAVYDSGSKLHSLFKERFFIIGGQWIVLMENDDILRRTYHHVAFKIDEKEMDDYLHKIQDLGLEMKSPRTRIPGEGDSIYFYDFDNNLFELHTGTLEERLARYQAER